VTWVGSLAGRLSGVIGCAVIAAYFWWLGLLLLVMWVVVRRVMLRSVLRQAIDVRGQTTETAARRARSRCSSPTASPPSAWPT
jgi:ATP-binding cassette subfamily B protein